MAGGVDDPFDFAEGDTVLVRVREHGTSGQLRAKFVAEVLQVRTTTDEVVSPRVKLDPPWDQLTGVDLKAHQAEFEVVDDSDEVNF